MTVLDRRVAWTAFGAVGGASALLLSSSTQVRYVPADQISETATFTYRAWDQTSGTASANATPHTADASAPKESRSCSGMATARSSRQIFTVLLGNGDGTFQSAVSFGTGVGPVWLAPGDLNGDGRPDLAVVGPPDEYSILLNSSEWLLSGSGDPNAPVTINNGAALLGTTTANGLGDWSFTFSDLDEGMHTLTASQTDAAGNTGSSSLYLTVPLSMH